MRQTFEPKSYTVSFPLDWLKAIRLFAAKDDVRYYLNGVCLSPEGGGGLVATDGYRIGAMLDPRFKGVPEIILSNATIDTFVRDVAGIVKVHKASTLIVTVQWEQQNNASSGVERQGTLILRDVYADTRLFSSPFAAIAGKFPDYSSVLIVGHETPYGYPQFNTAYLATFTKAYLLLNQSAPKSASGVHLTPCGATTARVRLEGCPQFEGAVMALRTGKEYDQSHECALLDTFVGDMKLHLVRHCAENQDLQHWQDLSRYSNVRLNRLFYTYVAKDDLAGAANILMMLHKRGDRLLPSGGEATAGNAYTRQAA